MNAYVFLSLFLFSSCGPGVNTELSPTSVDPGGKTITERFAPPRGYNRIELDSTSFGNYLRHLPLKPEGSQVHYFDGTTKSKSSVYLAVVDMEISPVDLQQCADAVMRLRGEYLFSRNLFDRIHFNFTNGFRADYSKWRQGFRIKVNGNNVTWEKTSSPDNSHGSFRKYMDKVFTFAGTLSLEKELKPIPFSELRPGDVIIKGGSPGHAVIVVDMAVNAAGQKVFMLAQSYMPAQETQILCDPDNPSSPWFPMIQEGKFRTPEWTFTTENARRFQD